MPQIIMMSATSLAEAIRTREISCEAVMAAYLDHIAELNPKVNAIVSMRPSAQLMEEARTRDKELAKGIYHGPLHGFPLAIKDLEATKGICTTFGSEILMNHIPKVDGVISEKLKQSGAIIIGKTNTPEFGLGSHTYNKVFGRTNNAYDQNVSAGGSSGGAAVSLALHMLPVADGSDYAGSLRNPAGWNNLYSLKPSFGRVPTDDPDLWLPIMAALGPMARNMGDLIMFFEILGSDNKKTPFSSFGELNLSPQSLQADMKGARIGWLGDLNGYIPYEKGVLNLCQESLKACENMGCIVENATPNFQMNKVWDAFLKIRAWQVGSGLQKFYRKPAKRKLLKPEAIFEIENGAKLSAFDISNASQVRSEWYRAFSRLFDKYDYLVLPSSQIFPFDVNIDWPKEIDGRTMNTYHEWMLVNIIISMTGCPVLTVPGGFNQAGLPMGLQIIAPINEEVSCLQFGMAYEKITQWGEKCLPPLLR